ncbi:hypothetical protein IGB42_03189 [Andreprevotia sp. IGB-42]|uniref:carbohydrate-binding protein n=1 Tax=Andreprevotia sp. IGB-42 TaxID=2497473 RepID=UPI0013579A09|nr:carbohydrate-binding protein [Andreprevotia sp. IGB-42]KAF0812200.1 hypothetical protein IGB42_03189 [Andreprevotia sp. IGB-42]
MHILSTKSRLQGSCAAAVLGFLLAPAHAADPACQPGWQEGANYTIGQLAAYLGHNYSAKVNHTAYVGAGWTPRDTPTLWQDLGLCSSAVVPTQPPPAPTPIPTVTPLPTQPPATPLPSSTPRPIATPAPTGTPVPSSVPTTPPPVPTAPPGNCQAAAWVAGTAYGTGQRVTVNGTVYIAKWWTQGDNPADAGQWGPWQIASDCLVQPTVVPTPAPADFSGLVISEIATSNAPADGAWLEIYNRGDTAYPLGGASVRTRSSYNCLPPCPLNQFVIPAGTVVPAQGFLVIAATTDPQPYNSAQLVYANDVYSYPQWGSSGFVELVSSAGTTIDFVRFGDEATPPNTPAAWAGSNVPYLPTGQSGTGKALVRPFPLQPDTHSAADWKLIPFSTPGGPNDVLPTAIDSDDDGIPDNAKLPGGSYNGINYYALGARQGKRDLFIQIDWMQGSDPAVTPRREALQKVVAAFASHNIAVHFDVGPLFNPNVYPADFNLGGGRQIPFSLCSSLDAASSDSCKSLFDSKQFMDLRRRQTFHYALFGNSQNTDGGGGSSGRAEMPGNDFIVTLGGWGLNTADSTSTQMLINFQAGTLMHELGHNLGLFHGGNDGINNKPNYVSVMNYLFQIQGVGNDVMRDDAVQRYYALKGFGPYRDRCGMRYDACDPDMRIDYSDGGSMPLDKNALQESKLLGRGAYANVYADWNGNYLSDLAAYSYDVDIETSDTVIRDYNDWAGLLLPFARYGSVLHGTQRNRSTVPVPVLNPVLSDRQPVADEQPLPQWAIQPAH